jgi:hypothetical protein
MVRPFNGDESMIRTKSNSRLRTLATAGIGILAMLGATASGAQTGAVATGAHANEAFCKTIIEQAELFGRFMKADLSDVTTRTKYFADQKELNATLSKTAPAALASDVALQTRNANASVDAQLARDPARIKASVGPLRSPEHLAASKRMTEYCGVKVEVAK